MLFRVIIPGRTKKVSRWRIYSRKFPLNRMKLSEGIRDAFKIALGYWRSLYHGIIFKFMVCSFVWKLLNGRAIVIVIRGARWVKKIFNARYFVLDDDLKIFMKILDELDLRLFQDDLNYHTSFCQSRSLRIDFEKCKHIIFPQNRYFLEHLLCLNDGIVETVHHIQDILEVLSRLKYNTILSQVYWYN